jgi:Uma2 family endonuclease
MSTPSQAPAGPLIPGDDIWRLSVERYHRMIEAGNITPDDRVELLEGILVPKMSKSPLHRLGTVLLVDALRAVLPTGWFVQSEQPVTLDDSEPEPDATVVRGVPRDYAARHPGPADVGLVVEVADSSLRRDRENKKRIYARNGVPVYWIVNVADRLVEVFADPSGPVLTPDYATAATFGPADAVPVALGGVAVGAVRAADLLP